MALTVYAGAWIRVFAPNEPVLAAKRTVIPCADAGEAQGIKRLMVTAGVPRTSLAVIAGMLPAKPRSGGTYVQITVAQALELFEV
jgi:hypothetical protein